MINQIINVEYHSDFIVSIIFTVMLSAATLESRNRPCAVLIGMWPLAESEAVAATVKSALTM